MRALSDWWRDSSGQSLAEFALVLPLLLLLIAGIIEFGRGYNIAQAVADAAREGARLAVVADNAVDSNLVVQRIIRRLNDGGVPVTTDVGCGSPGGSSEVAICTTYRTDPSTWRKSGEAMTVSVAVLYRMPLVGALMDWATGSAGIVIGSQATMRNE